MIQFSSIRKLPANIQGRDFVVGDLHGCYHLLERLLKEVHFDKSRDRLFSVGDLIDRGPESLRCLYLLQEPWFFAVQGNHELMMLNFFLPYLTSGRLDELQDISNTGFLDYGGGWVRGYFDVQNLRMTPAFDRGLALVLNMPSIWIVGDGEKRFHVIHAELVKPDFKTAEHVVWLDSDIDRWLTEQQIPTDVEGRLYWSRTLMLSQTAEQAFLKVQSGLSPTFCGHTYGCLPRQVLSHICLDTGAFVSWQSEKYDEEADEFGLTLFDVQASRWVSASYHRKSVVWGEMPVQHSVEQGER